MIQDPKIYKIQRSRPKIRNFQRSKIKDLRDGNACKIPIEKYNKLIFQVFSTTLKLPSSKKVCPLCHQQHKKPSTLPVSGYVYCYHCIQNYLQRHGCCPITYRPCPVESIIPLFTTREWFLWFNSTWFNTLVLLKVSSRFSRLANDFCDLSDLIQLVSTPLSCWKYYPAFHDSRMIFVV